MCSLYLKRAVEAPCCVGSRGASFGTPCHYICVTLNVGPAQFQTQCATYSCAHCAMCVALLTLLRQGWPVQAMQAGMIIMIIEVCLIDAGAML
jgi:hypothetical protein